MTNSDLRTATASPKGRVAEFDAALVQRISEAVYRARLCDESGEGADLRMIEEDKDGGVKLKNRARAYDVLTRAYLRETAATELFAALKKLEWKSIDKDNMEFRCDTNCYVIDEIRAAIAKATGAAS